MSNEQKERERLKRLRDAQIKSRDPGDSKIRHFDWSTTGQKPISRKPKPLLAELWYIISGRWKGALYGVLFGMVLGAILFFVITPELRILAAIPPAIGFVVGMVLGKTMQQDDL